MLPTSAVSDHHTWGSGRNTDTLERERKRERERETDRQTDRDTQTETETNRQTETERKNIVAIKSIDKNLANDGVNVLHRSGH